MALPSSGQISISQIRTELETSNGSLRYLSFIAGFSTPDSMSEFWGYSNVTYTLLYIDAVPGDMCSGVFKDIYYGSDGVYYYTNPGGGGGYTPVYNADLYWYIYEYSDGFDYVWQGYETNQYSTEFTYNGNYLSPCSPY